MAHLEALLAYARAELADATSTYPDSGLEQSFAHEIASDIALGIADDEALRAAGRIPGAGPVWDAGIARDPRVSTAVLRAAFNPNIPLAPLPAAVYLLVMEGLS